MQKKHRKPRPWIWVMTILVLAALVWGGIEWGIRHADIGRNYDATTFSKMVADSDAVVLCEISSASTIVHVDKRLLQPLVPTQLASAQPAPTPDMNRLLAAANGAPSTLPDALMNEAATDDPLTSPSTPVPTPAPTSAPASTGYVPWRSMTLTSATVVTSYKGSVPAGESIKLLQRDVWMDPTPVQGELVLLFLTHRVIDGVDVYMPLGLYDGQYRVQNNLVRPCLPLNKAVEDQLDHFQHSLVVMEPILRGQPEVTQLPKVGPGDT